MEKNRNSEKKSANSFLIASVVYLILGLVLLLWPGLTSALFCKVAGLLLLLYGLITCASFFLNHGADNGLQAELILGVVAAALGIFCLARPSAILSVLPVIVGLYVFIDALVNLKRALDMRRCGYARWTVCLVSSIVSLALGGLILVNPFKVVELLFRIVGAVFIFQGVSDLWSIFTLGKLLKDADEDE